MGQSVSDIPINMTSLSIVLLFINYLLLSSINEGDARGNTLKREGLKNENVLLHPKSMLIQPKTKRETGKTRRNEKSSNEGRKGRKGKRLTRKQAKPRAQEKKKIRNQKKQKTRTEKKKTRGRKKKNNAERNGKKMGKLSDTCFTASISAMKMWKDIVGNFWKQRKRMEKQIITGGKKNSKNGVFESVNQKLLSAGGSNASALSCAGSTSGAEALQLANLTTTLSLCQTELEAVCNTTNWPLANETRLQQCDASTDNFNATATRCLAMSVGNDAVDAESACDCWQALDLSDVRTCKFSSEAKAVANALKTCSGKFAECRKYEDDAIPAISACLMSSGTVGVTNGLSQNKPGQTMTCTLSMNSVTCSRGEWTFKKVANSMTAQYTDSNPKCTYQSLSCLPSGSNQTPCLITSPDKIYMVKTQNGNSCTFHTSDALTVSTVAPSTTRLRKNLDIWNV